MKKRLCLQRILLGAGLLVSIQLSAQMVAPSFVDVTPQNAPQVFRGNGAWGDYNNDGKMELAAIGRASDTWNTHMAFYTLTENGEFAVSERIIPIGEKEIYAAVLTCIDYNNDGKLDLLLMGETTDAKKGDNANDDDERSRHTVARLFKNTSVGDGQCRFEEVTDCGIAGVYITEGGNYASVMSVGDYNNDGYPDIALSGLRDALGEVSIYTNSQGTGKFTLLEGQRFPALKSASLAWGDYDGDSFLDLLVAGSTSDDQIVKVYHNEQGSAFTEVFAVDCKNGGAQKGQVGWLDANRDGKLDFLVTGESWPKANPWIVVTDLYTQGAIGQFTKKPNTDTKLSSVRYSGFDCADLNADGLLDIIVAGQVNNSRATYVAMHQGSLKYNLTTAIGPSETTNGFEGFRGGAFLQICDYDKDGYPDWFGMGNAASGAAFKIYHNTGKDGNGAAIAVNTAPTAPDNLMMTPNGAVTTFTWTKGTDVEAAGYSATLRSNLYVKKTNGEIVMLVSADLATGFLKIADCTLATMGTTYSLNIPAHEIAEWGVQTIDQGKMTSAFAKQSVLYRRCYMDGGWETICLPFDVTTVIDEDGIQLPKEDYTLKVLSSVTDGTLVYTDEEDGMMKANVPYILSLMKTGDANEQKQYIFCGKETVKGVTPSVEIDGYAFTGTYERMVGAEGKYVLNSAGTAFVIGTATTEIPAYCAYLTAPAGMSLKSISINNGGATSLERSEKEGLRLCVRDGCVEVYSPKVDAMNIYGIEGRLVRSMVLNEGYNRINGLTKGIYLISNIKVVVY